MTVRVVTDSTCDLPPELVAAHGITVVPLTVVFDDGSFLDGVTMSSAAFYAKLATARELPRTSQPSVNQFRGAYEGAGEGDGIVSIHISAKLSGTLNSATLAV